ncbi:MAG: hypothetical protein JWP97_5406 [Labilithrix sp.]|nr:hypothetical protein [Labilithrix sp.]
MRDHNDTTTAPVGAISLEQSAHDAVARGVPLAGALAYFMGARALAREAIALHNGALAAAKERCS